MVLFPSSYLKLLFAAAVLFIINYTYAQTLLPNVPEAFQTINTNPKLLRLKNNTVKIPSGGHLQGIQNLSDSAFVITASSGSISYYLLAIQDPSKNKGNIKHLQKIADLPFRHAGGCQLNGNKLFVGIEDNIAKNKSKIMMVTLNDSSVQLSQQIIAKRMGMVKRSTAGAVGSAKTKTGQYLVAVGDWDSRNIDFYISRKDRDTLFDSLTTFHAPESQKWCSYQAINLLMDTTGNIYLVGFGLEGLNNRADLFKVELEKDRATLKPISSRNFKCTGGTGFRYGAGIGFSKNRSLVIYSCARNIRANLAVNIFESQP